MLQNSGEDGINSLPTRQESLIFCILLALKDSLMLSTSYLKHSNESVDLIVTDLLGCTPLHIAC